MQAMRRIFAGLLALLTVLGTAPPGWAGSSSPPPPAGAPAEPEAQADAQEATPPRVSYLHGEVSFWRPGAADWAPAALNMPLAPGDVLYAGPAGNVEIQIGPRAFARAAYGAQLGLDNHEPDFIQLRVTSGYAALDLRELAPGHTVELDTPGAAFTMERAGYYHAEIGPDAVAVRADVSDAAAVKRYTDETVARWGGLHAVFNNAGINIPGVFHEVPDEVVDRTLDVNVKGCIYGCRYAIPHMLRGGGGSLINTSSVNGIVAEPFLAIYATSKGAIVMLSKGIALDYAKQGIRCNAIAPGWVDTPINYAHAEMLGGLKEVYATIDSFQPIGRPGQPREIANVALFLASDESSFVTGSVLVADGAMTAK